MKNLLFIFSFLLLQSLYAQDKKPKLDTLNYSYTYAGKNIAVRNGFPKSESGFSVKEVWINGEKQKCETDATAFVIDLSNQKEGKTLLIQIVHIKGSKPGILEPRP